MNADAFIENVIEIAKRSGWQDLDRVQRMVVKQNQ